MIDRKVICVSCGRTFSFHEMNQEADEKNPNRVFVDCPACPSRMSIGRVAIMQEFKNGGAA